MRGPVASRRDLAISRSALGRRGKPPPCDLPREPPRPAWRVRRGEPQGSLGLRRHARPGELDPAEFGKDAMARLIVAASGVPGLKPQDRARRDVQLRRERVAERFREGPVLLAGDAARRVTPRGATGITHRSATATTSGGSSPGSAPAGPRTRCSTPTRPTTPGRGARTSRAESNPNGSRRDVADELHVDLGGRIARLWLREGDERISTWTWSERSSTLFSRSQTVPARIR